MNEQQSERVTGKQFWKTELMKARVFDQIPEFDRKDLLVGENAPPNAEPILRDVLVNRRHADIYDLPGDSRIYLHLK